MSGQRLLKFRALAVGAVTVASAALVAGCGPQPGPGGSTPQPSRFLCSDGPVETGLGGFSAISADGRAVAWQEFSETGIRVSVYDTVVGGIRSFGPFGPLDDGGQIYISNGGQRVLLSVYPPNPPGARWILIDVATGTMRDLSIVGDVMDVSDDLSTVLVREWAAGAPYRRVDVDSGTEQVLAVLNEGNWQVRGFSPDQSLVVRSRQFSTNLHDLQVVAANSGELVADLGAVTLDGTSFSAELLSNDLAFVAGAVPRDTPSDGIPGDSAFTVDLTSGRVTRRDSGVRDLRTVSMTPDGERQFFRSFRPWTEWLRTGDQMRDITELSVSPNSTLQIGVQWSEQDGVTLHCL